VTYLPYPEPRYRGETGEASARFRSADAAPEVSNPGGTTVHYLATGAGTDGQLGLYRWEMGPGPGGPDPHFHRSITESFYVLSGTIRLHDGNGWTDGRPGDFLYVPQGGVHAFRNESGEPASMLILFTPGAPREDYFERVRTASAMTEEERAEFFLRHDTFWV
jgi:quercetin dioxygenase-like cupin family protein